MSIKLILISLLAVPRQYYLTIWLGVATINYILKPLEVACSWFEVARAGSLGSGPGACMPHDFGVSALGATVPALV